jgi:hypothetical protein
MQLNFTGTSTTYLHFFLGKYIVNGFKIAFSTTLPLASRKRATRLSNTKNMCKDAKQSFLKGKTIA